MSLISIYRSLFPILPKHLAQVFISHAPFFYRLLRTEYAIATDRTANSSGCRRTFHPNYRHPLYDQQRPLIPGPLLPIAFSHRQRMSIHRVSMQPGAPWTGEITSGARTGSDYSGYTVSASPLLHRPHWWW